MRGGAKAAQWFLSLRESFSSSAHLFFCMYSQIDNPSSHVNFLASNVFRFLEDHLRSAQATHYNSVYASPEIIHQAIWHHVRFSLSFHNIEDLLAERVRVSYETVRRSMNHFTPFIAAD